MLLLNSFIYNLPLFAVIFAFIVVMYYFLGHAKKILMRHRK